MLRDTPSERPRVRIASLGHFAFERKYSGPDDPQGSSGSANTQSPTAELVLSALSSCKPHTSSMGDARSTSIKELRLCPATFAYELPRSTSGHEATALVLAIGLITQIQTVNGDVLVRIECYGRTVSIGPGADDGSSIQSWFGGIRQRESRTSRKQRHDQEKGQTDKQTGAVGLTLGYPERIVS